MTKKITKWGQPWSEEDLQYLSDTYGLIPNKELAERLHRSEVAMLGRAGKLHIRATDNFYTASELARTLGIGRKPIENWVRKGWLKSSLIHHPDIRRENALWSQHGFHDRRLQDFDPHRRGPKHHFTEEDVIKCLRQRPWLVDLKCMERHYFHSVVIREWQRDPWYNCQEAAALLGLKADNAVKRYIHRGWLLAERKPGTGSWKGEWIIRRSAIKKFLANDPRPSHRYNAFSKARKLGLRQEGRPTRIGMVWNFSCPRCGQEVRIMAPPDMMGPEVREKFISIYVNGTCLHGDEGAELRKLLTPREYDRFVELTIPG